MLQDPLLQSLFEHNRSMLAHFVSVRIVSGMADFAEKMLLDNPDLVIADILMPTMDGCEFVRRLRAESAIAKTPVVFCTATYHERQARELAEAGVRIILVATIASARAAQNVMPPMPVVMLAINDPVGSGLVASLARPGGVTTGMATLNQDLTPKMLEIQREIIPTCKIMAALFNPANPSNPLYVERLRATAPASARAWADWFR